MGREGPEPVDREGAVEQWVRKEQKSSGKERSSKAVGREGEAEQWVKKEQKGSE